MKVVRTNGKPLLLDSYFDEEGNFSDKIPNHAYIHFSCENCGKEDKKQKRRFQSPPRFLCRVCAKKHTIKEKYGTEHASQSEEVKKKIGEASRKNNVVQFAQQAANKEKKEETAEKRRETNKQKYGGNAPASSEEIRDKMKSTNREKYGVDYYSQTDEAKKKKELTNIKKLGVSTNLADPKNKEKELKTKFFKYYDEVLQKNDFVKPLFTKEEYNGKDRYRQYKWKCKRCSNEFYDYIFNTHIPRCEECYPKNSNSVYETELEDFLKSLNIDFAPNEKFDGENRKAQYELDFYIAEYSLGIEFDGLYWHSIKNKDKKYHTNKDIFFEKKGIEVIHIFEDEWIYKRGIVKSIIRNRLNIYSQRIPARKCQIKELDNKKKEDFLNNNHIQGNSITKINLGLYYDNELVSVMTFSKSRFNKNYEYELSRFANKLNTIVVGGASRLLMYFRKNYSSSIISYCDKRLFSGSLYISLGMEYLHSSSENYYYVYSNKRFSREQFQKHKLSSILENFDDNLTEKENMLRNGYNIIYDCGNDVYGLQ